MRADADAPLAEQYLVVSAGKIRAGWLMESPEVGVTSEDEVIDVIEGRALNTGVLRVRFSRGWVSTQAGDGASDVAHLHSPFEPPCASPCASHAFADFRFGAGTQLLLPVGGDEDAESETEWETETGFGSQTEFETEMASETEFETDLVPHVSLISLSFLSHRFSLIVSLIVSLISHTPHFSQASETEFETDMASETEFETDTDVSETGAYFFNTC